MKAKDVIVVGAEVPQDMAEALSDYLAENEIFASVWEDREGGPSTMQIFLEDNGNVEEAKAALTDAANTFDLQLEIKVDSIRGEDWSENWKRFFGIIHISDHLVVRPPWETYEAKEGEKVLVLDPGMSFGTGKHPTTQACMAYLDELSVKGGDVLDIGTGSGILAIAASKLGYSKVTGIDNDEDAVRKAKENCQDNGAVANFETQDLAYCELSANIVVANVLAVVLIKFAKTIAKTVKPSGYLILSGILDTQYDDVKSAYEALGLTEVSTKLIGEWRTGLFAQK